MGWFMDEKPPSYQWYPRDFRAEPAVDAMTFDQRGRYQWALDSSWLTESYGVAPEDQWRRWMHYTPEEWPRVRDVFAPCFKVCGETWTQKRLKGQREVQASYAKSCSDAGVASANSMTQAQRTHRAKLAAAARWKNHANGHANGMLTDANSASASASALESKPTPRSLAPARSRGFDAAEVELPGCVSREDWRAFVEHRAAGKSKLTPGAVKLALKKLVDLNSAGTTPKAAIEQSIVNGWKGLFAVENRVASGRGGFSRPEPAQVKRVTCHYCPKEKVVPINHTGGWTCPECMARNL